MKMTLGKSIVLLLVGSLLGTALLLGGVAFITTRNSITNLRSDLLKQVDVRVQQRMQDYFDRAAPALDFMEKAIFAEEDFMDGWEDRARLLSDYLMTEPDIIWIYFADEKTGHMLGCNLSLQGYYTISRIHTDNNRVAQGFVVGPDRELEPVDLIPHNPNPYDPRTRPWFRQASEAEGLIWTPPYGFLSTEVVGITAARAIRRPDGSVRGVLGADLELGKLGTFLDEFEVGDSGAAFLLLDGGGAVVPLSERKTKNVPVLQRAIESRFWDFSRLEVEDTFEAEFSHEGKDYITLVQPLDLPGPTRYYASVVVPRNEYLDVVYQNLYITLGLGVVILTLAIGLGVWQARRVTEPLAEIGRELDSIGNLRFREEDPDIRSRIREVALFSDSVGKMKVSLRAFSRYVPRDLVRLLLARGYEAQLGGDLRKITVVFTDLAGFTAFSEKLNPDEAFSELSEFLEIVAQCQEKYHGITSSFTGDGTLALFNAPEEDPNHERDATLSALEILDSLRRCNLERKKEGKFEFRARIGINTADVLLGNLGTHERFAYTAIGDGVNLASRLEGLSKLYGTEILVGSECREAIPEGVEWRLVDRITVVGRRQATEIFEPLGKEGEVDAQHLEARDRYEKALHQYFDGNLDAALAGFHSALAAWPGDRAALELIRRCQLYIDEGLPEGWDGVYSAEFK